MDLPRAAQEHGSLYPTIDRGALRGLDRAAKLARERRAIDLFRTTARFFADAGEQAAAASDVGSLLVLRHYGVPTRVLDWTLSPWVAAYFAAEDHPSEAGELWAFNHDEYTQKEDAISGRGGRRRPGTEVATQTSGTRECQRRSRQTSHQIGSYASSTNWASTAKPPSKERTA